MLTSEARMQLFLLSGINSRAMLPWRVEELEAERAALYPDGGYSSQLDTFRVLAAKASDIKKPEVDVPVSVLRSVLVEGCPDGLPQAATEAAASGNLDQFLLCLQVLDAGKTSYNRATIRGFASLDLSNAGDERTQARANRCMDIIHAAMPEPRLAGGGGIHSKTKFAPVLALI